MAGAAALPADPAAIFAAWAEAYASRQAARSAALYTEDASLWGTSSAAPTAGRAAIAGYFSRAYEGFVSLGVRFDEPRTRSLGEGLALAHGRYTFRQKRGDGTEITLPARFSFVLAQGSDGLWRIVHHHSSAMPQQS